MNHDCFCRPSRIRCYCFQTLARCAAHTRELLRLLSTESTAFGFEDLSHWWDSIHNSHEASTKETDKKSKETEGKRHLIEAVTYQDQGRNVRSRRSWPVGILLLCRRRPPILLIESSGRTVAPSSSISARRCGSRSSGYFVPIGDCGIVSSESARSLGGAAKGLLTFSNGLSDATEDRARKMLWLTGSASWS
jgi:hypothetical protein